MKKTRVGIVGGGSDPAAPAFFGTVHRRAIGILGHEGFELVAGVLRSDPAASLTAAAQWGIKGYESVEQMLDGEPELGYVVIATPNDAHFGPAQLCVRRRIPVLCEKPLTLNLDEAIELQRLAQKERVPFAVAYTYCGSWPFLLARAIVQSRRIGEVRFAEATYDQGWQSRNLGIRQEWRQKRKRAGAFCCGGDIGSHGFQAIRWITGLEVTQVCVDATSHVADRELDDTFRSLVRLSNNADGIVTATQVLIGHKNDHRFRVCGSNGTVEACVEEPESVTVHLLHEGARTYYRGEDYSGDALVHGLMDAANWAKRLPSGHVEGFLAHLANIHFAFGDAVQRWKRDEPWNTDRFPSLVDGVAGMKILAACEENAPSSTKWTLVPIT